MSKVLIIGEAGVNHNGDMELAKKLIDVAVDAGVDIVKFQTFKASKLVSKDAKKADYQIQNMKVDSDTTQFEMLRRLELHADSHKMLIDYCKSKNIEFLSTPFDEDSIDLLVSLGIETFKIPSGEITNYPYLKKIGTLSKQVIISSGMSTLQEIKEALDLLVQSGTPKDRIMVLHCNTEYPTPMADVNLRAMQTIVNELGVKVGYSDHTLGIEVPIAAVAMGAVCIEKHFTLDRTMDGPDHKASLEPAELKAMVSGIRNIEEALGNGIKEPSTSELKNKEIARKSIHTSKVIKAGTILSEDDLEMKRPGNGISPMQIMNVIGKRVLVDLPADTIIEYTHLA